MEKILQSKAMVKLQDFGQALGRNKFLSSLQATMMSTMGIIMVGAISQILVSVLGPSLFNVIAEDSALYSYINLPYLFTINLLGIWVVAFFAFNYAKSLNLKSPMMNVVDALAAFLLVAGTIVRTETGAVTIDVTFLGSSGMFIGFLVVFISVHIEKFCADKNVRIKMPDVVPPFLQDGFASILPLFFSLVFFTVLNASISTISGGALNLVSGFMAVIMVPLSALTSVPGMFIICTFGVILWCFGIHGTMILVPIIAPLLIQAAVANGEAYAAGQPTTFYPVFLFSSMAMVGGTGNTLALSILGLKSKSKQISAISKISLVPGWFCINEPLVFGMPIMYNPILCIPYVLSVPLVMLLTLLAYNFGFLTPPWIAMTALLPMGVGAYFTTLSWKNALWEYLMIIPTLLLYFPFFKAYEKQLIAQEAETEEEIETNQI